MSGLNMDQLIEKLLTDSKARSEWLEVAKKLEERHPSEKKEKKEPFKVLSREVCGQSCRLGYSDGFTLCFTSDGEMFLEFVEKGSEDAPVVKNLTELSQESVSTFKAFCKDHLVGLEDLMFVITSVNYLISRDVSKAYLRNKEVVSGAKAEQKTRFISKDKKMAFVAGMICGRMAK